MKKMVLVDPRMLESLRSSSSSTSSSGLVQPVVNQSLKELDGSMKDILDSETLDVGDKAKAYYQILHRYLHRVDQYKSQPIGTLKLDNESKVDDIPVEETEKRKEISEEDVSEIINTLPQKFREKGRWFLRKISSSSDLTWNDLGQLIVRGKRIKGSNITDLLNDVIRPRVKRTKPPVGWNELAKEIKRKNIPKEFIGNNQRWDDLSKISSSSASSGEELFSKRASEESDEEEESFSTPASHTKKRRKRKTTDVLASPWISNFDKQ